MDTPTPPEPHFPSPYARPRQAPSLARWVDRPDGARIACFVYGTGQSELAAGVPGAPAPVVFLHGNGEEHGIFGPMIDAVVEDGCWAVGIDSRGQGRSTRGTDRLTYELMAQDALACLDALDVDRFHLVGFSDGAIEALILARDLPRRVASLLSMGANLTPEGVIEDDWDLRGAIEANRSWANWASALPEEGPVDPAALMPTAREASWTADLLQLMVDEPHIPADSLSAIVCPTTVMVGEFDVIVPAETYLIHRAVKSGGVDARLVVVPGAGHSLPKHAPDAVIRVMRATMARGA